MLTSEQVCDATYSPTKRPRLPEDSVEVTLQPHPKHPQYHHGDSGVGSEEVGESSKSVALLSPWKLHRSRITASERLAQDCELARNVRVALWIHSTILRNFRQDSRLYLAQVDEDPDLSPQAREVAERQTERFYDKLVCAVRALVPWSRAEIVPNGKTTNGEYAVVQFRGRAPTKCKRKPQNVDLIEADMTELLKLARHESKHGCARDALCAALATLASRREMVWLDKYLSETPARGYFAHALVDPSATFRLAFSIHEQKPKPASLILTHFLPLAEALENMDSRGPLKFKHWPREWCQKRGRQFAFQDMVKGEPLERDNRNTRVNARHLKPDPKLRELLRTKTPVLMLDSYVSLAPRVMARRHNLGDIIKEELVELLRSAKAQGRAVVFQVGGDEPHLLAEKVYLQPRFTEYGLRCGYLRCRPCPNCAWEREKEWGDRVLIGLQLP